MNNEIDWKSAAIEAVGHIDGLLLYATEFPKDSLPNDANAFLKDLRRELGMMGTHRTEDQWRGNAFRMPLLRTAVTARRPHIFLDCDGVLADFDKHALDYFGMPSREYEKRVGSNVFWSELEAHGSFFRDLPVMPDAKKLVDGVRHLNPTILTGRPRGTWAHDQKVAWAEEHFPDLPIITCKSKDKRLHAQPGDVLIDDWDEHRHRWIEMGGIFITHTRAETSLKALWAHYPELRN